MAESEARIGWGGGVLLSTDLTEGNLTDLGEVIDTDFPQDEADEEEVTHLKSPGRRKEFIAGLIDANAVSATMNYVPGSATDLLLTNAKEDGTKRKIRFVIPADDGSGDPDWNITTTCFVKKYGPDKMTTGKITATAIFRITGAQEQGAGASGS